MIVNGRHQRMNFFKGISVGIGLVASDAVRSGHRIEVDQSCTDSRAKRSAQEIFDVVVGTLSTDGVAVVFDQSIKDSIDIRRADLAKLHVWDEIFDDVVIALVTFNGDIPQLPSGLAADTSSQITFEVGLYGIKRLALSLSDVNLSQFQIRQRLHVARNGRASFIVVTQAELLVDIFPDFDTVFCTPLPQLQNPPPTVNPDVSALHDLRLLDLHPV